MLNLDGTKTQETLDGTPRRERLRQRLIEWPQALREEPVTWTAFLAGASASCLGFVVLIGLVVWSINIGRELKTTLDGVNEIVPEVKEALGLLKLLCAHQNFTHRYGPCPWEGAL